jgi:hypothetical protein
VKPRRNLIDEAVVMRRLVVGATMTEVVVVVMEKIEAVVPLDASTTNEPMVPLLMYGTSEAFSKFSTKNGVARNAFRQLLIANM